ncbi:hypothetical protein NA56DRAFT_642118 [Hyaloscypha hepaticicola]|uniref:Uncharacterized protein n=1 Tax=Hyaloscypha hepaticicola TaxID=2082293 RepID=A0A2J6QHW9_9HELO|nr:hypothetical protein NA56DRAFT_642118 [Hyaloscypha hepaticicola]
MKDVYYLGEAGAIMWRSYARGLGWWSLNCVGIGGAAQIWGFERWVMVCMCGFGHKQSERGVDGLVGGIYGNVKVRGLTYWRMVM